ncbi:hypothetical protein [Ktedonobacter racemifer]|nr:hypothetical protein [Ktedonobacter racemifer]
MEEKRTILFVDEAGFALLPMAVLTYSPCGQTPILPVPLTHDHLSVIGALSTDGRLFMQMQRKAYKGPDVIRFLRLRFAQDSGEIAHHLGWSLDSSLSSAQGFLGARGSQALHLEALPAWLCSPPSIRKKASGTRLKRRELKNMCCTDLWQVEDELRHAKERLRHRKPILLQCFAHAGCPV